jgi:nicotinamidase-related amidase
LQACDVLLSIAIGRTPLGGRISRDPNGGDQLPENEIGDSFTTDNLRSMTLETVDPERSALLVMDYERAVVESIADADGLLDRVAEAIRMARQSGVQVVHARVAFENSDYATIPETNKSFSLVAPGFLHVDSPAAAFDEKVAPAPGDIVVRKMRPGAILTTDLDQQLRGRGITTLILAGIHTSGAVLSTVRDAADRDYRLIVLSDASADPDDEVHRVLMTKIFPRQSFVMTTKEFGDLLSSSSRGAKT